MVPVKIVSEKITINVFKKHSILERGCNRLIAQEQGIIIFSASLRPITINSENDVIK